MTYPVPLLQPSPKRRQRRLARARRGSPIPEHVHLLWECQLGLGFVVVVLLLFLLLRGGIVAFTCRGRCRPRRRGAAAAAAVMKRQQLPEGGLGPAGRRRGHRLSVWWGKLGCY